jgi:hypothetical protein
MPPKKKKKKKRKESNAQMRMAVMANAHARHQLRCSVQWSIFTISLII